MQVNPFLSELLTLQQDADGAISAPSNWLDKPLLEIETHLTQRLADTVERLVDGRESKGFWQFFIGSPGNGKSAAVGWLVRQLDARGFVIQDPSGNQLRELLNVDKVPFLLEVKSPDGNLVLWIMQDASVVKDPYSLHVDPRKDLLEQLMEAANRGISMIVCANRGILEGSIRQLMELDETRQLSWVKALKARFLEDKETSFLSVEGRGSGPKLRLDLNADELDAKSLVCGSDEFDRLLDEATKEEKWEVCGTCEVQQRCPFFANRRSLKSGVSKENFRRVVQRAELWSGQIIVFREALAILSILLSGCRRDYEDGSPCEWVHRNSGNGNLISLLFRRAYMTMFSSQQRLGFESDPELGVAQREELQKLADECSSQRGANLIREAYRNLDSVATDVGVQRLLGSQGSFAQLDMLNHVVKRTTLDKYDTQCDLLASYADEPGIEVGNLEKECFEIWGELEGDIENLSELGSASYWWLRRWITAFSMRIASYSEGTTRFGAELDEVSDLYERSDDLEGVELVESGLREILSQNVQGGIKLNEVTALTGDWVRDDLRVKIPDEPVNNDAMGLQIKIGKLTHIMSPSVYAWLRYLQESGLSRDTFPEELSAAIIDVQVRAACQSEYATVDGGVELIIEMPGGGVLKIERRRGRVRVNESA